MKQWITLSLLCLCLGGWAQTASIQGQLQDDAEEAVAFANVALYFSADSTLAKVETSNEAGIFAIKGLAAGNYYLEATFVGFSNLYKTNIQLQNGQQLDLGVLKFTTSGVDLQEVSVTAQRAMVEIKPDRTVFNVQGTINSVGSDAISLLRKAPGVTVDNNDNVSVLGRSGVLVYVDGKRLPLSGQDLSNYLQNLPAEQIDRIDIISNPGARYEAEGNAGIIDIRLKKDKNLGANGSVNGTYSQGRYARKNFSANGNYRNKLFNTFATAGFGDGKVFNELEFQSYQNGLFLDETMDNRNNWEAYNYRLGTDFFLAENHTAGFLISGRSMNGTRRSLNRIALSQQNMPTQIDSILVANTQADDTRTGETYNLNYRFDNGKGRTLNLDLDYGNYENDSERLLPNRYFDAKEETVLTEVINSFDTPTDINISTFKVDYEDRLWGGS